MSARNLLIGLSIVAVLGLALGACESPPEPSYPEITFTHKGPIRLSVSRIEVRNEYRPPFRDPNVEHLFPRPPGPVAERWARDRLVAAGAGGIATYVVTEASVTETPLEKSGGIAGLLTTDQEARYDGVIAVEIRVEDESGRRAASATARVERTRSVPEGLSLNEREQIWFEMTERMMVDLDAELERNIDRYLGSFRL